MTGDVLALTDDATEWIKQVTGYELTTWQRQMLELDELMRTLPAVLVPTAKAIADSMKAFSEFMAELERVEAAKRARLRRMHHLYQQRRR